jgi:hypothetical protein
MAGQQARERPEKAAACTHRVAFGTAFASIVTGAILAPVGREAALLSAGDREALDQGPLSVPEGAPLGWCAGFTVRQLIVLAAASLLLCGFALTPEYEQQARDEVAFCVGLAQRDFPSFDAAVRSIDPATGDVAIDGLNPNARGEPTVARCLMAIRKWRLVERHLPRTVDPTPPPVPYAGTGPLTR